MLLTMIVSKLSATVSRRNFLAKAAMASSAVTLAMFAFDETAVAGCGIGLNSIYCCCLCSFTLCGRLTQGDCPGGIWCWICNYHTETGGCQSYRCYECYNVGSYGSSSCNGMGTDDCNPNIRCSKSVPNGPCV